MSGIKGSQNRIIRKMKCPYYKKYIVKTIIIDNTEYEIEQHDNNKTIDKIKIPKGWRLLKPWEAQRLWDLGYFRNGRIFVENTNEELKKDHVARFGASPGLADFYARSNPQCRYLGLGVIFARDLI